MRAAILFVHNIGITNILKFHHFLNIFDDDYS